MATTKVIATTWAKKDLLKKLNETLKRMDAEIVAWEKDNATLEKRQDAWDKKAIAWAKQNISSVKGVETTVNPNQYRNRFSLEYSFDNDVAEEALGQRPSQERKPAYKDTNYNRDVSEYEQIQNAIALIDGATDTEFKISSSSTWASFIR
jgi:hypothetical protein